MIPYGKQDISDADIAAVVEVLKSDFLTQGPAVPAFEQAIRNQCGADHAVVVNSATSALHLACLALGVGHGSLVWTSPVTFVASANCALYCGADVDFVDIDPHTYNLSVEQLAEKLAAAERDGCLPDVVIPVHLAGQSCDMRAIHRLSQRYGFRIIEDASHAIGADYEGRPVGSCDFSDIVVFSFHPVKIVTTGEGGCAVTRSSELAAAMELLRSHGITRDAEKMTCAPDGGWYYQQIALGFNYRMTEIQAALGISQMQRLSAFVARRRQLASQYMTMLEHLPVTLPYQADHSASAWHLFIIRLHEQYEKNKASIFDELRRSGIGVNLHYIPVHTQPYYQQRGFCLGDFPEAEHYYRQAISIPMFHAMTDEQQLQVVTVLERVLQ